ncbi:MAG: hypothetical protein FIA89_09465 [Geobacter sp.]|nr:hypothetical protein [Geobacter sp.]
MIHFLLTPDKAATRRLRRVVATQHPGLGVIVGTWPELLSLATKNYLLPPRQDNWQPLLETSISALPDAFWSASLAAAPTEVPSIASVVGRQLVQLLEAVGPSGNLGQLPQSDLPGRTLRYLSDLLRLHTAMGNLLPVELATIKSLLNLPETALLRPIQVYHHPEHPWLNRWQQALIDRLKQDAHTEDPALADLLHTTCVEQPTAPDTTTLGYLQRYLFTSATEPVQQDSSVQWLAVRDYLQEIEVAAGIIQTALDDNPDLTTADIALLLPNDQNYHSAVVSVFSQAGIPLSGLDAAVPVRDLGSEAVYHLLLSLDKPAPIMALASLLTSPLMPWDKATGHQLALKVINNVFKLEAPEGFMEQGKAMLDLFRERAATLADLKRRLKRFPALLNKDDIYKDSLNRVQSLCTSLLTFLETYQQQEIPWLGLKALATPRLVPGQKQNECTLQGVAVFHEGEEPWRQVKCLFVLGCSDGHYPAGLSAGSLFIDAELEALNTQHGLSLETAAERNARQRQQIRRQLCSAGQSVTFLLPRRDPQGKPLSPSASVTFAEALLADPNKMICELDSVAGRQAAFGLPLVTDAEAAPPRCPEPVDLRFDKNLLELGKREDGSLKPESPSRLEKLMVSPLAWLFERLGVESRDWAPEDLDVMSKGTLAHEVFEKLFAPGIPLPDSSQIEELVPVLFDEIITSTMPFLKRSEWKVERKHLQQEILKAALQWREILHQTEAKPIAVEIGLKGDFEGIPIHGNADLLLELPDSRLYVVDYKKSGSNDRRLRMKTGYDHQAELYRTMIKTGGLKEPDKAPEGLADKLTDIRENGEIGTMYYLLNDQTALADTTGWLSGSIGNLEEMQANVSVNAMNLIKERFAQIRQGVVELNTTADEKEFKNKRGISAYALKGNSLVAMWLNVKLED